MRWFPIRAFIVALTSGCGLLSGLDDLVVSDAGGVDASSDALVLDALLDAPPVACEYEGGVITGCLDKPACASTSICCVSSTGYGCMATCPTFTVGCMSGADCAVGNVCCAQGLAHVGDSTCPYLFVAAQPPDQTTCVAGGACVTSASNALRLCSNDAECADSTAAHCRPGVVADGGLTFGVCLP